MKERKDAESLQAAYTCVTGMQIRGIGVPEFGRAVLHRNQLYAFRFNLVSY